MSSSPSFDDLVRHLQATQRARAEAGISATFVCDPDVLVGRAEVTLRVHVFASNELRRNLTLIVRCAELADFGDGRLVPRRGRDGEYVLKLPPGSVAPDRTYHLTVHLAADAPALAECTLHTFTASVVATARRDIRDLIFTGARSDLAAPSRTHSTAGSRRRARGVRRAPRGRASRQTRP
jgi:hypothetical protein